MINQIRLQDGLAFGKGEDSEMQVDVELRELTAGDLIDAEIASEKMVMTDAGAQLVASPAVMGFEMIRRSVLRIGKIQGPLSMSQLKSLSKQDLNILNVAVRSYNGSARNTVEQITEMGR